MKAETPISRPIPQKEKAVFAKQAAKQAHLMDSLPKDLQVAANGASL